jgi:hypothetical protein
MWKGPKLACQREQQKYTTAKPCFCHPLHAGCHPKFRDKTISPESTEWIEHDGPVEIILIDCLVENWAKGAAGGCLTCGAIQSAATSNMFYVLRGPGEFMLDETFSNLFRKDGICQSLDSMISSQKVSLADSG